MILFLIVNGTFFKIFTISSFPSDLKSFFHPLYCFSTISVCFFNSLRNREYSHKFNVAAGKFFFPVKNSSLLAFPDDKVFRINKRHNKKGNRKLKDRKNK